MTTPIHRRVEAARRGESAALVAKMASGWLVMADQQVLRGYCLLLPDPVVPHLNALAEPARSRFLADMTRAGDALLELTGAVRINYEMLGNLDPALHAHIIPRYANERDTLKTKPVWFHDWDSAPRFDPARDGELLKALAAKLGG